MNKSKNDNIPLWDDISIFEIVCIYHYSIHSLIIEWNRR